MFYLGICLTVPATVYQEPNFGRTEGQEFLRFCLTKNNFAFESIATQDLMKRKKFNFWNLWMDLT